MKRRQGKLLATMGRRSSRSGFLELGHTKFWVHFRAMSSAETAILAGIMLIIRKRRYLGA